MAEEYEQWGEVAGAARFKGHAEEWEADAAAAIRQAEREEDSESSC